MMKKRAVAALLVSVALAATGCSSGAPKETEAQSQAAEAGETEALIESEEETTEEKAESEAASEEASEEESASASEEASEEESASEEASEEESESASEEASEEESASEEASEEESVSEEETTEEESASEEETTEEESESEEETVETETESEAVSESETKAESESASESESVSEEATEEESVSEEETTEEESASEEEITEEESASEEETAETETESEAVSESETKAESESASETESVSEEETTEEESASEEETTEAETESEAESQSESASEETSEEETTEAQSESETEIEIVELKDIPDYDALTYVTLGEYKGVTVVQEPIEISEEEIQAVIDDETVETLTEGTVETGDVANIDYEGTVDGEAFDGGTAQSYNLEIGSGTFIDGFEDGLVGLAVGEETDLYLTFPEKYHNEDLAGKECVFHVTINSIDRIPELTDEVAAKAADVETVDEYKDDIRERLVEEKAALQEQQAKYDVIQKVYENAEISGYPAERMEFYTKYTKSFYAQQAEASNMTLDEMLEQFGMTEEDLIATIEAQYQQLLSQEMVIKAVAEAEEMELTDKEYQAGVEKYAEQVGMEEDAFVEEFGETYIREQVLMDKAIDFLVENANYTEETEETAEESEEAESEEAVSESDSEEETEAVSEEESASEETSEEETTETESETAASEPESESETEAE